MDLVKIDPVGAQAAQTVLDLIHDIATRTPDLHTFVVHRHAKFSGKDNAFAIVAQDLAHAGFRAAPLAVGVGGVEQVNTEVGRLMDNLARVFRVNATAEV